jgi:hypothetical protein
LIQECTQCGSLEDAGGKCSVCGTMIAPEQPKPVHASPSAPSKNSSPQKRKMRVGPVTLFIVASVFICLGNLHIVHGSTYTGTFLIPRLSFGFGEMFINTDTLLNMPYHSARSQYPLSVAALQRRGFLESDAVRELRIQQEVNAQLDQATQHAKKLLDQSVGTERSEADQIYKLDHGHYPDEN